MIKEKELYNADIKWEFLNQYDNERTRLIALYPMRKAKRFEERAGKDLFEMSLQEIEEILYSLSSSSKNSIVLNVGRIEEYILWASANGYRRSNITPFPSTNREAWMKKFVADYRNYAFTRQDIIHMTESLVNDVDKALLLLLFEGASGRQYSEVLNLKVEDIDSAHEAPTALLRDSDKSVRLINITPRLEILIRRANRQHDYKNKNGTLIGKPQAYSRFAHSEYVFKKVNRGAQRGSLNNFFVNRKVAIFKEIFDMPYLKANHIIHSGIMHMAHQFHKRDGIITKDALRKVAEQYGAPMIEADGKEYRKTTHIRKILERRDYKELYGMKAEFE